MVHGVLRSGRRRAIRLDRRNVGSQGRVSQPVLFVRESAVVRLNARAERLLGPVSKGCTLAQLGMARDSGLRESRRPGMPLLLREVGKSLTGWNALYLEAPAGRGYDGVLILVKRRAPGPRLAPQMDLTQVAGLCHDLRAPVQLMMGAVQLMRARLPDEGREVEFYLEMLTDSGCRLLRMVNNLVDQARAQAGQMRLFPAPGDLAKLLRQLYCLTLPYASHREIALELTGADEPVEACYDSEKLERMVLNLISNALKYTKPGGTVRIALRVGAQEVAVDVCDNGVGIAPEQLKRLFVRYATSERDSYRGSGMGLALVREMARLHGGDVAAYSALGRGSRFTITLPRVQPLSGICCPAALNGLEERVRVELSEVLQDS